MFLEDIPGLDVNDAYHIDRKENREIYRHGCVYEKHVAKFKEKKKAHILGFRDLTLSDLVDTNSESTKKTKKKSRYFSKSSKSVLFKVAIPIKSVSMSIENKEFIPFSMDPSSNVALTPSALSNESLSICESLNRRVYDKPNDLSAWLELIDIQAKGASFLHISDSVISATENNEFKDSLSNKYIILKKQLSIAERALNANPGCLTFKMLTSRLNELVMEMEAQGASMSSGSEAFHSEKITKDWAQFVFTYPQLVIVWRGYISHLMGPYSSPVSVGQTVGTGVFSRIDGAYKRGLSTLSGILSGRILSHHPQPGTAENTVGKFVKFVSIITIRELEHYYYHFKKLQLYW